MDEAVDAFTDLMARVYRDDRRAVAELMALYEPQVHRAARALLGRDLRSWIDPTDLVQSVHLQLLRVLKHKQITISSPAHLRSYALTLLRHRFVEQWRRRRCQARYDESLTTANSPTQGRILASLRQDDPLREAEYNDLVDHFLRKLGTEDRLIVAMRCEGYLIREIATAMGIEPATLRMRISRLRKRLRSEAPADGRE